MIFIATPCYNGDMKTGHESMCLELASMGVQFAPMNLENESLIPRARNNQLSYFHWHPEFTHIVFIDADIYISAQDIMKMINRKKNVIGALVRLKSEEFRLNFNPRREYVSQDVIKNDKVRLYKSTEEVDKYEIYEAGGELVKADRIGTAVLILNHEAVDKVVAKAKHEGAVYGFSSVLYDGAFQLPPELYEVCPTGCKEDERKRYLETGQLCTYYSEDYFLCENLRECGEDIWVDRSVNTMHIGNMKFSNKTQSSPLDVDMSNAVRG